MPQTAFYFISSICIFCKYLFIDCPLYQWYVYRFSDKWNGANGILLFAVIFAVASLLGLIYRIYLQ